MTTTHTTTDIKVTTRKTMRIRTTWTTLLSALAGVAILSQPADAQLPVAPDAAMAYAPAAPPPASWLRQDPADQLYQRARESLSRRRYVEAAERFSAIRRDHPRSGYVADSYLLNSCND